MFQIVQVIARMVVLAHLHRMPVRDISARYTDILIALYEEASDQAHATDSVTEVCKGQDPETSDISSLLYHFADILKGVN